jgi:hypothetical protein
MEHRDKEVLIRELVEKATKFGFFILVPKYVSKPVLQA